MSTLPMRTQSALLVIDMQHAVLEGAWQRDAVVQTVQHLVERARAHQVAVVWVQHTDEELVPGSPGWQWVQGLQPARGEAVVRKAYRDAFDDTELHAVLAQHAVGALWVCGAQTDMCVRSTLHGALVRGYDVALVADAHTTVDRCAQGVPAAEAVVAHTNVYWARQRAPGRSGTVLPSSAVVFGVPGPAGG